MDNYNQPPMRGPNAPWFTTWLVISIAQFLCCNWLTGVISFVLIIMGNGDYQQGNIREAENKRNAAKIATIVGVIIGVVAIILVLLYIFVIGVAVSQY